MSERVLKIDELEFSADLYPRASGGTWWAHVYRYADEMKAGSVFPPIAVGQFEDRLIVVDGWHRCQALKKNGEAYVKGIIKKYGSLKELFADTVRCNSTHGIQLTPRDKVRIIDKLEELEFTPLEIGELVKVSSDMMTRFTARTLTGPRGKVHMKAPLADLYEKGFIDDEIALLFNQDIISTRRVTFIVNQMIAFIDGDAFPWADPNLGVALTKLYHALKEKYAPLLVVEQS